MHRVYEEQFEISNYQKYVFNKYSRKCPDFTLQTFLPQPKSQKIIKFEYPLHLPPESNIKDHRTPYETLKDVYAILSGTPPTDYKACVDNLLNRDSSIPEIDPTGLELSTSEIRRLIKLHENKKKENAKAVTLHAFVSSGPILFASLSLNEAHCVPALVDSGATNSTVSTYLLQNLGLTYTLDDSVQYYFENSTEAS